MNDRLVVIDVGGTTIKYGLWNETTKKLSDKDSLYTPESLEEFYGVLKFITDRYEHLQVDGVGISIPGAVDQKRGVIEGISALPYIHGFPIKTGIESKLDMKVAMENDANCAALAELSSGVAQKMSNIIFMVIGTGVGGAVVVDRKILHGSHLYGGEFGMMIGENRHQLSLFGTAVHLAERYNKAHATSLSGKEVLDLANAGDSYASVESRLMFDSLAQSIYNLQFITDPEAIVIGGGVSASSGFINSLKFAVEGLFQSLGEVPLRPNIVAADFHNDANLIGAAYNFYN